MTIASTLKEGEQALAKIWKLMALRGALGVTFAIVILVWPAVGLTTLIALFGAFALVSGVSAIVGAFRVQAPTGHRIWLGIEGVLGVIVGVVVFVWPGLSALGLLYAIAAWAIAIGLMQIPAAFALPVSGGNTVLLVLGGLASIAFGVIMFAHPGAGAIALLALISALLLVGGLVQIAYAFELRSVLGDIKRPFQAKAGHRPLVHQS